MSKSGVCGICKAPADDYGSGFLVCLEIPAHQEVAGGAWDDFATGADAENWAGCKSSKKPTLHVVGPDDVVAMPDYETAVRAAALLERHRKSDPPCWGEVIEWPHPKGYDEDLARGSWREFLP